VYALPQEVDAIAGLNALLQWLQQNNTNKIICKTQILIVDSYKLKIISALITNFHQPASTLLLLIAAVVGNKWQDIYRYALENDYRFLSYGDGSLLFRV
ncbi:MAG: S-adenosylmethionine:tRNA ribosyltransferase-isomerase, partial [Chitinophagales bacterium]